MAWEVEQKFAVEDGAALRGALDAAGTHWEQPLTQADYYWNHPARDFAATDEALRLRQVGLQNYITYKGPRIDAATKTRQEIELVLPDGADVPERFGEVLAALGFRPVAVVRKQRRPGVIQWQGAAIHVALDTVERVGDFVELEILADDSQLEGARSQVQSLARLLGLTRSERRSYLELLLQAST